MWAPHLRKNIQKTKPDSSATAYYKSLQDYEYSKLIAEQSKGNGIKEMILEQIVPDHVKQKITISAGMKEYRNAQNMLEENQK